MSTPRARVVGRRFRPECAHLALMMLEDRINPAIQLEFFVGASINDTVLSGIPFPNDAMTGQPTVQLNSTGSTAFVQVALHQTAPTTLLDAADGLAAYLIQGIYDVGQAGQ